MATKHTINLRSPKSDAATTAAAELAELEANTDAIASAALAGNLSADGLANHTNNVNLARLRADASRTAAEAELNALAPANTIADAIAELLEDPDLATTGLTTAAAELAQAIIRFRAENDRRNTAIHAWANRLRALGVPDTGLTVNQDDITIRGTSEIAIGAGRVSTLTQPDNYIRGIVRANTSHLSDWFAPDSIERHDQRDDTHTEHATVKLTRDIGGHQAGDTLTTRTHSRSVLATMIRDENAELIEGSLPTAPERTTAQVFWAAPANDESTRMSSISEQANVDAAVTSAFTND